MDTLDTWAAAHKVHEASEKTGFFQPEDDKGHCYLQIHKGKGAQKTEPKSSQSYSIDGQEAKASSHSLLEF